MEEYRTPGKKRESNLKSLFMAEDKNEDLYHIGRQVVKQGPQSQVENKAGIKKFARSKAI